MINVFSAARVCVLVAAFGAVSAALAGPKNIILFIGDGMSVPQRMIANEFALREGKGPLAMNSMPFSATTRTCSANSLVTDSAAASTAIACGAKTKNHYVGIDPEGARLESCAEYAKKHGMKVGICTSVTITHATPAGFYAHHHDRGNTIGIATDLAKSGFDLFAGGGLGVNGKKAVDAYATCEKAGYRLVTTKADFLALRPGCGNILTKFTNSALANAIDAASVTNEPTLAQITAKAIELLRNEKGFFLMVEGGRIDWAGHANDAATNLRDVLALDEAVKVALDFEAKTPEETLVIVTGDHETGGMTMGLANTGYALYMDRLANQTMSVDAFTAEERERFAASGEASFEDVAPLITRAFGLKFSGDPKTDPMVLSKSDLDLLRKAFDKDLKLLEANVAESTKHDREKRYHLGNACRLVLSRKCGIGWTSGAHTAMPVLTSAVGADAARFSGFMENTDIAKILKSLMN